MQKLRRSVIDYLTACPYALLVEYPEILFVVCLPCVSAQQMILDTKILVVGKGEVIRVSCVRYDIGCITALGYDDADYELKFALPTLNTDNLLMTSAADRPDYANYVEYLDRGANKHDGRLQRATMLDCKIRSRPEVDGPTTVDVNWSWLKANFRYSQK